MRFTIDDKRLIKWIWVKKNYAEKRLLKMFLTEDEVLMEVKTLVKKYQCEIFNFVDLCSGLALCGRPQPKHESMMPLLSLS